MNILNYVNHLINVIIGDLSNIILLKEMQNWKKRKKSFEITETKILIY